MDTATYEITLPLPALLPETRTAHHISYDNGALLLWNTEGALTEIYTPGSYVHARRISVNPSDRRRPTCPLHGTTCRPADPEHDEQHRVTTVRGTSWSTTPPSTEVRTPPRPPLRSRPSTTTWTASRAAPAWRRSPTRAVPRADRYPDHRVPYVHLAGSEFHYDPPHIRRGPQDIHTAPRSLCGRTLLLAAAPIPPPVPGPVCPLCSRTILARYRHSLT